jgi:hypothetical protein
MQVVECKSIIDGRGYTGLFSILFPIFYQGVSAVKVSLLSQQSPSIPQIDMKLKSEKEDPIHSNSFLICVLCKRAVCLKKSKPAFLAETPRW